MFYIIARKAILSAFFITFSGAAALAAPRCGTSAAGFPAWIAETKRAVAAQGIGRRGQAALDNVRYAHATIKADRSMHSFKLDLQQFMRKRGASAIVARGKAMKRQNAALFARIERQYGVPAGPLLAIWGMETGFGNYMGNQHILSAVATLAYDCRRPDFFTQQLYAILTLIDRGSLDPRAIGAMHGEIGQTQFLPVNVLKYGVDGDGNGRVDLIRSRADALASTANFLRSHGWRAGAGYQPGEPNFGALQGWNKASVYQQAIAIMGKQIDN